MRTLDAPRAAVVFGMLHLLAVCPAHGAAITDLAVAKAKITLDRTAAGADKLTLKAGFIQVDAAGSDPSAETTVLTVGSFSQTIPPGSFERRDGMTKTTWRYRGPSGGPVRVLFKRDGALWTMKIVGKGLTLEDPGAAAAVSIQIGDGSDTWSGFFQRSESSAKTKLKFPPSRGVDADGDGLSTHDGDCDDQQPTVRPGATEVCDARDNDCNGQPDDGVPVLVQGTDVGECESEIRTCIAGVFPVTRPRRGPAPEVCDDGLDQNCDGTDCAFLAVAITDPAPATLTAAATVDVTGTVDPRATTVNVNGVYATPVGGSFAATDVPLISGSNTVTAVALDDVGNVGSASVAILRDDGPPSVAIASPRNGATLFVSSTAVAGLVNDIVVGTVNGGQAQVVCNGVAATVANRSFLAAGVPLASGPNTITCSAVDQVGNSAMASVNVTAAAPAGARIEAVSGDLQSAPIGGTLASPLVVRLLDDAGLPVSGRTATFRVAEGDGMLAGGAMSGRAVAITTDGSGQAAVAFTLGMRAGASTNRVEAAAVGFSGTASFTATALPGAPARIVVDRGSGEQGAVGQPLHVPFVAVVVDAGDNRLGGVPVTFTVTKGGGSFAGQPDVTVPTDSDGHARALLTLGPDPGFDNNAAQASFAGNTGPPATFTASAVAPGDLFGTKVSGVILDNTDQPVPGATVRIRDTPLTTLSDAQGQFVIEEAPVGRNHLVIDGATVLLPGVWPRLEFEMHLVPGVDNVVSRGPIHLLPLNVAEGVMVGEDIGGTLTLAEVPGFALEIAPGSVTFRDGSHSGLVSVTLVHSDKVPMTPTFGQQPRFVITVQPPGARFDPPARLTVPNVDALPPGRIAELYSFDHDLGQFVAIGTGTVSEDGSVITSDPGVGILEGGWHSAGSPVPSGESCGLGAAVETTSLIGSGAATDTVQGPTAQRLVPPLAFVCDLNPYDCVDHVRTGAACECIPINKPSGSPCFDTFKTRACESVTINVQDSCQGRCDGMGKCVGEFSAQSLLDGACAAVDKIFNTDCMGEPLRTEMQNKLRDEMVGSLHLACDPRPESAAKRCASAPHDTNVVTVTTSYDDCDKVGGIKEVGSVILHEALHAFANSVHQHCLVKTVNGEEVKTPLRLGLNCDDAPAGTKCIPCYDARTDLSYGCELRCFSTLSSPSQLAVIPAPCS